MAPFSSVQSEFGDCLEEILDLFAAFLLVSQVDERVVIYDEEIPFLQSLSIFAHYFYFISIGQQLYQNKMRPILNLFSISLGALSSVFYVEIGAKDVFESSIPCMFGVNFGSRHCCVEYLNV